MSDTIMLMDVGITLTAFGAMLAGFYSIARLMLNQATRDRDADRKERQALGNAIRSMARNSEKVAVATSRTADEAKARNGHLAELVLETSKQTLDAIQNVNEQHIDHMEIKKATIKKV